MAIVTQTKIEKYRKILNDIEQYIKPMAAFAKTKFAAKRFNFFQFKPEWPVRPDIFYYGLDTKEYVKINYAINYTISGSGKTLAEGFPVCIWIDIYAYIEDIVYHSEEVDKIKEYDEEAMDAISLRPIDHIAKEYMCEQKIRDSQEVKDYYDELIKIVEKASEYVKKYYKNTRVYIVSHFRDISVYKKVYGKPEQYKEYFMDLAILARADKTHGHKFEKVIEKAKERDLDLVYNNDEIRKHIELKKKKGQEWIGPYRKVMDAPQTGDFERPPSHDYLMKVEELDVILNPDAPRKEVYKDGASYEGQMKNGLRHGKGVYIFADGEKYEGEFVKGKRHGKGTYIWKNGEKYVGSWSNGKKHGEGIAYYKDGSSKKVVYDNGKLVSKKPNNVKKTYDDGSYYEGEMVNGKRHGKGTYYWKSGNKYIGEWKNGVKHGEGIIYYKNGVKEKAVFENGECLKKTVFK